MNRYKLFQLDIGVSQTWFCMPDLRSYSIENTKKYEIFWVSKNFYVTTNIRIVYNHIHLLEKCNFASN